MVEASSDWIEWAGGNPPRVDVRLRNGDVRTVLDFVQEDWEHRPEDPDYDIIAYRVVQA